jgi:hypothetical protein
MSTEKQTLPAKLMNPHDELDLGPFHTRNQGHKNLRPKRENLDTILKGENWPSILKRPISLI